MATRDERITALQARMANRDKKLEAIKTVQKLKDANKADKEALEKIKADKAKTEADKKRKTDKTGKILIGVGVQMISEPLRSRMVVTALSTLTEEDRERARPWVAHRDIDLTAATLTIESVAVPVPVNPPAPVDPTPAAVMRVLGLFDVMELSFIEGQFLKVAYGEDRDLMERLFADLNSAENTDRRDEENASQEAGKLNAATGKPEERQPVGN